MQIEENIALSELTTFKTGGPVRFLLTLEKAEEIEEAVSFAKQRGLALIPIGGGSNMLAPDQGVEAVFVRLLAKNMYREEDGMYCTDGGASWDALVAYAVNDSAWGLENLSAIPGTVGAAVVQNIGAYGAALSDTLFEVKAFDMRMGKWRMFAKEECRFGYRTSIFKQERDRYFITEVSFHLSKTPTPNLAYKDLKSRFDGKEPTLSEIRDAVIEIRKGKFPPLADFGTAGSFFLNPIVSEAEVAMLSKEYPEMPFFKLPEGGIKLPVAWLFDHVLSIKGMREGKAFVWEKQPLVIAAEYGATAKEVRTLAEKIAQMLYEKTNVKIIPEVRIF